MWGVATLWVAQALVNDFVNTSVQDKDEWAAKKNITAQVLSRRGQRMGTYEPEHDLFEDNFFKVSMNSYSKDNPQACWQDARGQMTNTSTLYQYGMCCDNLHVAITFDLHPTWMGSFHTIHVHIIHWPLPSKCHERWGDADQHTALLLYWGR